MGCYIQDLRNKDVICASDGCRLGNVDDVEIDINNGKLSCIVIFSKSHIFSKGGDIRIPWESIKVIGEDTILVDYIVQKNSDVSPKKKFF